ncbi:uncharacterized protein LOC123344921 isoform X2 [Mauremys mutica]|uniref:uncharacterized protein LOC123344921 isoform X2 n=1 Tax=Mauremys mutica TaxID=74926 RepID=UPI001D16E92B|nr:uncharacterized protein LOC123344921 isoform X2 [Mauremys mutica]
MKVLLFCPSFAVSASLPGLIIFFITFHIHKLESAQFSVTGPDHPVTVRIGKYLGEIKEQVTEIDDLQRELDWRRNII